MHLQENGRQCISWCKLILFFLFCFFCVSYVNKMDLCQIFSRGCSFCVLPHLEEGDKGFLLLRLLWKWNEIKWDKIPNHLKPGWSHEKYSVNINYYPYCYCYHSYYLHLLPPVGTWISLDAKPLHWRCSPLAVCLASVYFLGLRVNFIPSMRAAPISCLGWDRSIRASWEPPLNPFTGVLKLDICLVRKALCPIRGADSI